MKKTTPKIIIIGAGPCGLGAGWRLSELGYDNFDVYEQASYIGGLATSFTDEKGFTWDVGGHVLHSHYTYFDDMFEKVMQKKYLTHQRDSWIYLLDRFVAYPFQNNIELLPEAIRDECLNGLKEIVKHPRTTSKNFAEWIQASFGKGIAKYFMTPYNKKVWSYPLEDMSYSWVGDRVAPPNNRSASWGPNATFKYPELGGTGSIWNAVADTFKKNIHLKKNIVAVDTDVKQVVFQDGTSDTYDELLTTMPIDTLVQILTPKEISGPSVRHSSVTIVGMGFRGDVPELLKTKSWMYFPEELAPFFRATVFSNYSPHNAPNGHWSLMTEVSSSAFRKQPKSIEAAVLHGAKNVHLIEKNQYPADMWSFFSEYGYPTPTLNRDAELKPVQGYLASKNIYSRGRFGAWKYEVSNQDHSFMQGVEWVESIIAGKNEITLNQPDCFNKQVL